MKIAIFLLATLVAISNAQSFRGYADRTTDKHKPVSFNMSTTANESAVVVTAAADDIASTKSSLSEELCRLFWAVFRLE